MRMASRRLIQLDPRTLMAITLAMTLVTFASKPFWLEMGLVIALALLQAVCGQGKLALGSLLAFAALVFVLDYAFAAGAAYYLSSFIYSFTLARRVFVVYMVAALLVSECSVHRIVAGMRKLQIPESVLIALSTGLRYFPTLAHEMGHIRDAIRLRDMPVSERAEAFLVPLMMSAANTADELSRAAVCRGIENPAPRADTEHLHMGVADWAVLALFAGVSAIVLGGML